MADKKRKGLMSILSDYQKENKSGPYAKGAVKGKGPVKSGKEYGKTLKQNKKEDASGPKVLAPKKVAKPASGKTTPPKPVPQQKKVEKKKSPKRKAMVMAPMASLCLLILRRLVSPWLLARSVLVLVVRVKRLLRRLTGSLQLRKP